MSTDNGNLKEWIKVQKEKESETTRQQIKELKAKGPTKKEEQIIIENMEIDHIKEDIDFLMMSVYMEAIEDFVAEWDMTDPLHYPVSFIISKMLNKKVVRSTEMYIKLTRYCGDLMDEKKAGFRDPEAEQVKNYMDQWIGGAYDYRKEVKVMTANLPVEQQKRLIKYADQLYDNSPEAKSDKKIDEFFEKLTNLNTEMPYYLIDPVIKDKEQYNRLVISIDCAMDKAIKRIERERKAALKEYILGSGLLLLNLVDFYERLKGRFGDDYDKEDALTIYRTINNS